MTTVTSGGTTATIQSPTLEGQFFQLVEFFQNIEASTPSSPGFFTGNLDTDLMEFSGTFKIPVVASNTLISLMGNASLFLPVTAFSAGTGGTFTATTAIDYFLQVLARLLHTQNDDTKNLKKLSNVSAKVDLNKNSIDGNFTLPFTKVITATGLTITPATYLL